MGKPQRYLRGSERVGKLTNLSGSRFGKLIVKEESQPHITLSGNKKIMWKCLCDCGKEIIVDGSSLKRGSTRSCGCFKEDLYNIHSNENIGKKFNNLTVVKVSSFYKGRQAIYECLCDCGITTFVRRADLKSGRVKSCGCLVYEANIKNASHVIEVKHNIYLIDGTDVSLLKSKINKNNTSGIKGVSFDKKLGKWNAYITFKKARYNLGYYEEINGAISARKEAEKLLFKPLLDEFEKSMKLKSLCHLVKGSE